MKLERRMRALPLEARGAFLGLVLALNGGAGAAQDSQPSAAAGPSARSLSHADEAWDIMNRFSVCVVTEHFGAVTHILALPDDEAVTKGLANLAFDDCLRDGQLKMPTALFRGGIYRALYLWRFGKVPQQVAAITARKDWAAEDADVGVSNVFGDCVVRLSPDAARDLVLANAATTQERNAIAALHHTLADCLPPKVEMSFTPWGLQGTLAEALYERTVALSDASKKSAG